MGMNTFAPAFGAALPLQASESLQSFILLSNSPRYSMQQPQILGLLSIFLLVLDPSQCSPITAQCVEHTYCSSTLKEYHTQLINLPTRINERSVAPWSYEENFDLNRVPQIIYEANCLNSHTCNGIDSSYSLESIPIAIKMPFLRKNPRCPTLALEFEDVNIACICATSRQN